MTKRGVSFNPGGENTAPSRKSILRKKRERGPVSLSKGRPNNKNGKGPVKCPQGEKGYPVRRAFLAGKKRKKTPTLLRIKKKGFTRKGGGFLEGRVGGGEKKKGLVKKRGHRHLPPCRAWGRWARLASRGRNAFPLY